MTEQPNTQNDDSRGTQEHAGDPRERYERTRDDFGRALFAAAEERETKAARAPRRSRIAIGGTALAGGLAALAIGITLPGGGADGGSTPGKRTIAIGAGPAVAAVTEIRDALHTGVLLRDITTDGRDPSTKGGSLRTRMRDWTDLQTRDQHVQFLQGPVISEFWNPGANERITLEPPEYRAPDGRRVISHVRDTSVGNMSATQSPAEEIDWLLKEAEEGRIDIRDGGRPGERILEASGRCFSWNNGGAMECAEGDANPKNPDKNAHWPDSPPEGAESVRSYQRWWIADGDQPRMLRYENGTLPPTGNERTVTTSQVWNAWKVLPRTAANLALVHAPAFDPAKYLVVNGNNSVMSQSLKAGKITCKSDRPDYFC